MREFLRYDDKAMWQEACQHGTPREEYRKTFRALIPAVREVQSLKAVQGWMSAPDDRATLALVKRQSAKVRVRFDRMIVIGIGGSDLAARTLWQALGNPKKGIQLEFLSSPDPEMLAAFAAKPKSWWKRTAVNVVSKSGTTLETLTIAAHVISNLKKAVGKTHAGHVFVVTEENEGPLHSVAKQEGYAILAHPKDVGGRFSALSVVGLFPAACAGIRVEGLLSGARGVMRAWNQAGARHSAATFAAHHVIGYARGLKTHVLMPYADSLANFGLWYRQIWAESLGKRKGSSFVGPTPACGTGPVDQHSQIQLYNEGPADKIVTFLEIENFRSAQKVPNPWPRVPETARLAKLDFGGIMRAELEGTSRALTAHGRPNGRLVIPKISEESVGALFQFYMLATATAAELLGIDAFDQPGVEEGKKQTKAILGV
jgi:glucose-6-phosphate isomerase